MPMDGAGNTFLSTRDTFGVIQPSTLQYPGNKLQLLCRSRQNYVIQTWSEDNGLSWSPLTKTDLPNPNSGTDAVSLQNGLQMLVYNPLAAGKEWWEGRSKLKWRCLQTAATGKMCIRWKISPKESSAILPLFNHRMD